MEAVAIMMQGQIVDLDANTALHAAVLFVDRRLPMGDSIILAIAQLNGATLRTEDARFRGIDGVQYVGKV